MGRRDVRGIGLLLVATVAGPAQSQVSVTPHYSYVSANELSLRCQSEENFDRAICAGYVAGAVDMLELTRGTGPRAVSICLPHNPAAQRGQLIDVVKRYLAAYPENRQGGAAALVFTALSEAFPCR
jgi:hypothetical protein